ncbi:unnamed protein product [Rhodiola kirilowii]
MSPNFDSTVQTQMAMAIFKSPLRGDCHGSKGMEGKAAGRRRVFVQTETGYFYLLAFVNGSNLLVDAVYANLLVNMQGKAIIADVEGVEKQ